ncbi:replication fork protection complex subunit Swi1 [Schizosaccharomyces cryophilus OY26]|uniref:Replication fork protection complex subunit Swi1 n=1 Tax=Schizosaccharomyces cryophilus (strain OY26 / ATCC MYA-4695 / CBS 11777 / NBRC 106824 / NRRL Y48691) TaxID=653667 RepID=S9W2M1_SCHCR|nr:replication fork protection complex subunit Swi1 [Schizosaccharomyces cryophilus OY26]EPY54288.1 replication fork protection complex subunit Swi1 [Schizosaccharomyces cryophilus OY26]
MELDVTLQGIVSAIGGFDYSKPDAPYVVGDDALACLKDLKRYLQIFDEKYKVWQVRFLLSKLRVVVNDLCPILAFWDRNIEDHKHWRIALAALELLVPLTWPLETEQETYRENVDVLRNLQHSQNEYKSCILNYMDGTVLKSILAVLLKPLSLAKESRSVRDNGIIRITLLLLRNITQINEDQTKNETIVALEKSHILDLIVTLTSNLSEFGHLDVYILEIIYYIIRGIGPSRLFKTTDENPTKTNQHELNELLQKESNQSRYLKRNANTRHNRFGTMISIQADDRRFTIASQKVKTGGLDELDNLKKHRKRSTRRKHFDDINKSVVLNSNASEKIKSFLKEFLEAGFNVLVQNIVRALEREDSKVFPYHKTQFMFVQAFFLESFKYITKSIQNEDIYSYDYDYGLISSVLDSRNLIMHQRILVESQEMKIWSQFQASMLLLSRILLTVRSMSLCSIPTYQDLADHILSNLFYQEEILNIIYHALKGYKTQSFGYLEAITELTMILLKELERYSSAKQFVYVKSRRRKQKSVKLDLPESDEDEESMSKIAQDTVQDRLFDVNRFQSRYCDNQCISTFTLYLKCYQELTPEQIHRAISFFYLIFVKLKCQVYLYRLDFLYLLEHMYEDRVYFPSSHPQRKEFDQFFTYYVRKLSETLTRTPALYLEIPFPKMTDTFYYLQYGKIPVRINHAARKGPLYDTVQGLSHVEKVAAVIACLINENKGDILDELKTQLNCIIAEKQLYEQKLADSVAAETESQVGTIKLKGDTQVFDDALLKDGKFRLLLNLFGFQEVEDEVSIDALWFMPYEISYNELVESSRLLRQFTDDPPTFEGVDPENLLVRKQRGKVRLPSSSESEAESEAGSSESAAENLSDHIEFEKDDPLTFGNRKTAFEKIAKKRKMNKEKNSKNRKVKPPKENRLRSTKFIIDSDEDSEAETAFFKAEATLRERNAQNALQGIASDETKREVLQELRLQSSEESE